jgi:hypothetical protein
MQNPSHLCLVVSSQRSGSTLLCKDLQYLGNMGQPDEHLWPFDDKNITCPADIRTIIRMGGCLPQEPDNAGLKVMINYLPVIARVLNYHFRLPPGRPREMSILQREDYYFEAARKFIDWSLYTYEKLTLFILVRENILDQAISRLVARNSGIYQANVGTHDHPVHQAWLDGLDSRTVNIQILDILVTLLSEQRILQRLQAHFSEICCPVEYGMLATQPDEVIKKMEAYANSRDVQLLRRGINRTTKKVVSLELNHQLRSKFRAFMEALSNDLPLE